MVVFSFSVAFDFIINLYAVNAKSTWLNNLKLCFSVNQWKIHTFDNCSIMKKPALASEAWQKTSGVTFVNDENSVACILQIIID